MTFRQLFRRWFALWLVVALLVWVLNGADIIELLIAHLPLAIGAAYLSVFIHIAVRKTSSDNTNSD